MDVLRRSESEEGVFTGIALKALEINEASDPQEIVDLVDKVTREYKSADARMYALHLLLMIKEPGLAKEKAGKMLETTEEMVLPYKSHIAYLAGVFDEAKLLEASPRIGRFDIGLKAWAEGDMEIAKESFRKSCEEDIYTCQYWWSRVFLERLE